MTERPTKTRDRSPKPISKIEASPERIARAVFSAVKRPDPSICVPQTANRKPPGPLIQRHWLVSRIIPYFIRANPENR